MVHDQARAQGAVDRCKVHPLLWVAAALFVVYFLIGPIRTAAGI